MMNFRRVQKIAATAAFGMIVLVGTGEIAQAQTNRQIRQQERRIERQERRVERAQRKYDRMRYRVYRNGNYYYTDDRGANLLRQAVNYGYQQGYRAGRNDGSRRGAFGYNRSSIYRRGNYGYQSYVDSSQYQYYFRQGFERGYQDGYYSRNQYGNNGVNILTSILSSILNLQNY